ncbi:PREDICTED: platelet endothelial aggregation receptor 1 [Gekko japonicus]|uniref:Platelet endothelial aggregation receptor 1 n=1 Tax=Gekko japonicus TaxID=146911 RepID=A0ABM1KE40_GEKJA|nr:PREDICTED: platelet endothelial aggregation receptor 1 [Gekko japonicus]
MKRCTVLWLWMQLDWGALLSPNDPNVCSHWESFTTPSKESYVQPFAQVFEEPCNRMWPFAKTCIQHRVLYKAAYRQGVKVDYRRRHRCCRGYYERADLCVPRCTQECVHGRCVAPDQCQCEQGWRGADCSSDCSKLFWGPDCKSSCTCVNGGTCDPLTGACTCPPGYRGPLCQEPCAPGMYGQECLLGCHCENAASCDRVTGACLCPPGFTGPHCEVPCLNGSSGVWCHADCVCQNGGICHPSNSSNCACPPGWMGAICSVPCPERRFGSSCQGECLCHNGGQCDLVSGQCQCTAGYIGERCREECPIGKYGQDCSQTCDCANGGHCFHINGGCLCEAGYYGSRCEERKCPAGLYGLTCLRPCPCDPRHTQSCHPLTGECTCKPGRAGLSCNETCPHGYHGAGCREPCLCLNGGTCDSETGLCLCAAGYTDEHCSRPCPSDTYGANCSLRCACRNAFACSPVDGACACKEGWHGVDCSAPCPAGTWGAGCNGSCQCANAAACSPVSGVCSCGPGWHGSRCEEPCPDGSHGLGCSQKCACQNADGCDPGTGQCRCLPGWTGPHCSQRCAAGRWGLRCLQTCTCKNGAICSPQDGSCDCPPGFRGPQCQRRKGRCLNRGCPLVGRMCRHGLAPSAETPCEARPRLRTDPPGVVCTGCPLGFFGDNCTHQCQCQNEAQCHPETGRCLCLSGFTGARCETRTENPDHPFAMVPAPPTGYSGTLGAVIGIGVMAALLVAVLALFLYYRHWQKGKESQHLSVAYTTGRTDTSEYAVPDIPPSYTHYYSNPSYHTLSPCAPSLPVPSIPEQPPPSKLASGQLFSSAKSLERDWPGLYGGVDCNATLPADWKHQGSTPALSHRGLGGSQIDRSYSYTNGLGKYHHRECVREEPLCRSDSSLSSENPYATIKDLPVLAGKPSEGGYMEMRAPARRELSYAEIGLFEASAQSLEEEEEGENGLLGAGGPSQATPDVPPNHYDSPKNSHIPSHYDVPPVRHYSPSPPRRRRDR